VCVSPLSCGQSSPVLATYDTVVVASENGIVAALDGTTGVVIWSETICGGGAIYASPALSNDNTRLYVGVFALAPYSSPHPSPRQPPAVPTPAPVLPGASSYPSRPRSCALLCYACLRACTLRACALLAFGALCAACPACYDRGMFALQLATGATVWTAVLKGVMSSPTVGFGDIVCVPGMPMAACVSCRRIPATHELLVVVSLELLTTSPHMFHPPFRYIGSDDDMVHAIHGADGACGRSARCKLPLAVTWLDCQPRPRLLLCADVLVVAAVLAPGATAWTFRTGNDVESVPSTDPAGNVYVGSNDGNLYSLDGATGAVGPPPHAPPLLACRSRGLGGCRPFLLRARTPARPVRAVCLWSRSDSVLNPPAQPCRPCHAHAAAVAWGLCAYHPPHLLLPRRRSLDLPRRRVRLERARHLPGRQRVHRLRVGRRVRCVAGGFYKWARGRGRGAGRAPAWVHEGGLVLVNARLRGPNSFPCCGWVAAALCAALDSDDGSVQWVYKCGGVVVSSPAVGLDGTLYIGTESGIYAFNDPQ
jgi:outer membrane protein assembly factor BamB